MQFDVSLLSFEKFSYQHVVGVTVFVCKLSAFWKTFFPNPGTLIYFR